MAADDLPEPDTLAVQAATLFDVHDHITRVLKHLALPVDELADAYDINRSGSGNPYDLGPMLRLYLYKEITGLSQKKSVERLQRHVYPRQRLGFDTTPKQQTVSYTWRHRFPFHLRQYITDAADAIREKAREHDDFRDNHLADPPDPDSDDVQTTDGPVYQYVDKHAPDLIDMMLDDVVPSFETGRASNTTHDDTDILEQQLLMSLEDPSGTRAAYRTFNKFHSNPAHHDTHVRAVKKLGDPGEYQITFDDFAAQDWSPEPVPEWRRIANTIQPQFSDAVGRMLDSISSSEMFTEPAVAAIDITGIPFHRTPWKGEDDIQPDDERIVVNETTGKTKVPKDEYPTMVNGGKDDGVYEYQYATLTIVGRNVPLVIAVEPIRHNSDWEGDDGESVSYAEVVDRLMEQATELVDIHLVMADKAFDQHGVFHVLDQRHDVDYLIPKKKDSKHLREQSEEVRTDPEVTARVEQGAALHLLNDTPYIDTDDDPDVGEDNYSHDVTFMHVPADRNDWIIRHADDTGYAIFVTNREDVSPLDAEGLTNRYSERWDIEIEYKMIQPLIPSIASTDYRMRFFAFVFSCLVYNLWRAVDHSLKEITAEAFDDYGRGPHEDRLDPLLPLADYLASSIILLFMRGWDPPDATA